MCVDLWRWGGKNKSCLEQILAAGDDGNRWGRWGSHLYIYPFILLFQVLQFGASQQQLSFYFCLSFSLLFTCMYAVMGINTGYLGQLLLMEKCLVPWWQRCEVTNMIMNSKEMNENKRKDMWIPASSQHYTYEIYCIILNWITLYYDTALYIHLPAKSICHHRAW